ncbi:MAG: plasmid pRiA4b ORF-3 family protein [Candidatus Omnitrophota bacterium]
MIHKNMPQDEKIYRLNITLQYSNPPIWRSFEVPYRITLSRLHRIIQIVMGWEDDHLWDFVVGKTFYSDSPSYSDLSFFGLPNKIKIVDSSMTMLCAVLKRVGNKIVYIYDMGDNWKHDIVLEEKFPPETGVSYPRCIAGERACPPEDCGGIGGYYSMMECLSDPQNSEYEFYKEWLGDEYDPAHFDLEKINMTLKKLKMK